VEPPIIVTDGIALSIAVCQARKKLTRRVIVPFEFYFVTDVNCAQEDAARLIRLAFGAPSPDNRPSGQRDENDAQGTQNNARDPDPKISGPCLSALVKVTDMAPRD
jgi:hypothetical protein